jgi:hypothetical protein
MHSVMKLFSNNISAGLFFGVVLIGLSAYAYVWYMAYAEKHGANQRAIETCKETYTTKLHDFKLTFENVTVRVVTDSDLGRDMEVTGTATYVDKDGSAKKEAMGCKVSE